LGNEPIKILALGDSYTIGEGVGVNARWPVQLADSLEQRQLPVDTVIIIAQTGWTTNNLLNAIESRNPDTDFNFVTLLIGVNNQYQGQDINIYKPQFEELLDEAIAFAGNDTSQVLIVSIPDYAYTPFGLTGDTATISDEIDQYNNINKEVANAYGVNYLNITPISRQGLEDESLVAGDGLHPSGKMYSLWVEKLLQQATLQEPDYISTLDQSRLAGQFQIVASDNTFMINSLLNEPVLIRLYNVQGQQIRVAYLDAFGQISIPVKDSFVIYHITGKQGQFTGKILLGP
jgi:lysophospholipase L1-like esterase